jgi:hypothetical protein
MILLLLLIVSMLSMTSAQSSALSINDLVYLQQLQLLFKGNASGTCVNGITINPPLLLSISLSLSLSLI